MKSAFSKLRDVRLRMGLTQTELATKAGVSLATVQNIEAGRGNPAWSTVQAMAKSLDLQIELQGRSGPTDCDELALFGCPIMTIPNRKQCGPSAPTRDSLIGVVQACESLLEAASDRETRAIMAWLSAIRDHYPSVFRDCPSSLKSGLERADVSAKLRRIALSRLGRYL